MLDKMLKASRNIISLVKTPSELKGGILMMKDSVANYEDMVNEREQSIQAVRKYLQDRIESVCRQQTSLTISDTGFGQMSSVNYDESWQASVVKMLQDDGYRCILSFSKEGSSLTVCWRK